jgi:hypothetical protein
MEVSIVKMKLLPVIALFAVGLAVGGVIAYHWSPPRETGEPPVMSAEAKAAVTTSPVASIPAPVQAKKEQSASSPDSTRDAPPMPSNEATALPPIAAEPSPAKIAADSAANAAPPVPLPQPTDAPAPVSARVGSLDPLVAPAPTQPAIPIPSAPVDTIEPPKTAPRAPELPPIPSTVVQVGSPDMPPPHDPSVKPQPATAVPALRPQQEAAPEAVQPNPSQCPWSFQVTAMKGRAYLEARIGDDLQFTVSCENLQMKTPAGAVQAEGDVKVKGTNIEGTCKKLTLSWSNERIQLEGGVKLKCKQDGQDVELTGEQLSIKLAVVETLPMPAPAE